ncbi:hypothetical protein [Colwellia sp. 12G3]|uniref:hypothetical protein n=1 Tax=Colwellia sp. 12G3 TaxID=2058299 RepID=UPI000C32BA76|nr:hypothetical protein [Colwellia sp. 12G3]PKI12750.1 hypothetical protein CXF71_18620 [Colwellia sp. 12G3]
MFLLSDVLKSYSDAGLQASVSILFDKNEFSHKIYLFSHTSELNQPTFNQIYNSLTGKIINGNANSLVVKSISSWVTSSLNFSVSMTSKELSIELGNAPSAITNMFEKLPSELFNLSVDHTLIEISINTLNQNTLVDLLLNDDYLSTQKFQLIDQTSNFYRVIDIFEPTTRLKVIKKQKSLMDDLINQKLSSLNGKLKGIRGEYIINNITFNDYSLVCLFYGYENIDEYEKSLKSDFLKRSHSSLTSPSSSNDEATVCLDKKLTMLTLIDDLLIPSECNTIIERIRKFTPRPFNVEKLLKVEEYKFEWLQGITPEMIHSFKIFKAMLNDAVTGFSTNTLLLKATEVIDNPPETNIHSNSLIKEKGACPELNISLKSKLKEMDLSLAYTGVVNRLNQAKRTSLTVYDFLSIDSSWFLGLSGIKSKHYSDFLDLRAYLQSAMKLDVCINKDNSGNTVEGIKTAPHHLPNEKSDDILFANTHQLVASCREVQEEPSLFREEQRLAESNINSLKPNDICIGDWEDILEVTSKMFPNDKTNQLENIKSQIQHYYDVRDKHITGFSQELIKLKETADWLFPGDYNKQLSYLNEEVEKQVPSEPAIISEESSSILNESNEIELELDKLSTDLEEESYKNIPNDILEKIKEWAFEGYFDDKEMYSIFVQEQSNAYIALNDAEPKEMPTWAWKSICDYTESKYIGDFTGQLREVQQHIESYMSIESISSLESSEKVRKIKQAAREDLPGDYKGQFHSIKASLKVLDSEQEEVNHQEIATKEIANLRPKEIRAWDWEETLNITLMECPNDPIGQLKALKVQVSSFYDIDGLTKEGYENEVGSFKKSAEELFTGDYVKQLSHLINGVGKLSPKASVSSKEKQEDLSEATVYKPTDNVAASAKKKKVKELSNSAVYDKNKSEKNFLSKLSSIFKTNRSRDIFDDTNTTVITSSIKEFGTAIKTEEVIAPNITIETPAVKELKPIESAEKIVYSKVQSEPSRVEECHFVKFNKKSEIGIEVQALKSFDAFDFESINNKLVVIINSNHLFYNKLYRDSSVESKRVIDMMISSLCHLSHLNISETVKQQDKKLFSRWSEYLEEYLLEE